MLILFTATIFFGALLLFSVQPMVGRMLLPVLGGAPAVWNTTLVFYQAALLAGYAYAHFATKWLGVRRQAALHLPVLLLPLLALPIAIPYGWTPPPAQNPIPWLLGTLAVTVGLPFFVVSATSPLLQRWFSAGGHHHADDPYFLYAASNGGSLLALVSYPFLVEPRLGLGQQSRWWAAGYIALVVLTAICGAWVWRVARHPVTAEEPASRTASNSSVERLTWRRRLRWVLLAFVPCSLMLSVTTYVTSEIAPIPLMWVIPLGIYLLTFVLVFARRRLVPHQWMVWALPVAAVILVTMLARMTLKAQSFMALGWPVAAHFAGLFIVAMLCHGELANDRPAVSHLTEFYLWISAGGVLGGMFNALLAPLIFPTVLEYPITLLLACALIPQRNAKASTQRAWLLDAALPALLGLFTAGLILMVEHARGISPGLALALECVPPAALCLWFFRRPLRLALGVLAILLATTFALRPEARTLLIARSFFGINRVELFPGAEYIHILMHGTTPHGMQSLEPRSRRTPLLYYTRSGPLGVALAALPNDLRNRVALVGLGAGTIACYAEPGQEWTFYEIDPEVERIARDPRYFTYLQDCPATVKVVLGDARLSLQNVPDGRFGILVLDAYNSDTIPLHLVTREALALYLQKSDPNGALILHITNRHVDLEPVFARLIQDAGLFALCWNDPSSLEEYDRTLRMQSRWLVISRNPQRLSPLAADARWHPPRIQPGLPPWTDDYESVFSVFHWD
ncbi:MAG: fused MFS/spermidine synthase [Verrucomicrobiia bacterium]|jgi:hypothetical protein